MPLRVHFQHTRKLECLLTNVTFKFTLSFVNEHMDLQSIFTRISPLADVTLKGIVTLSNTLAVIFTLHLSIRVKNLVFSELGRVKETLPAKVTLERFPHVMDDPVSSYFLRRNKDLVADDAFKPSVFVDFSV